MRSFPNALATDAEDVIWALQTADALWKRQERVDAIVWLRRAAQAAGDAQDDDRALELARNAAELAEWIAQNPGISPGQITPTTAPPAAGEAVDNLLRGDPTDEPPQEEPTPVLHQEVVTVRPPAAPRSPMPPAPVTRVPTAAEAHAGLLDPWSDPEAPTRNRAHPPAPAPMPPPVVATPKVESDEVVTSAPPVMARAAEAKAFPPPAAPKQRPPAPAMPSRVRSPPPPAPAKPPPPRGQPPPSPAKRPPPAEAPVPDKAPPTSDKVRAAPPVTNADPAQAAPPVTKADAPQTAPSATKGNDVAEAEAAGQLDLSHVEALSDLPDDARAAFAGAAIVKTLAREDEVSGFALALVLDGDVDVSATIVDAAAQRMRAGAVMRSRGTIEHFSPMRLVGASETARVATWDEHAVSEAFRTCPWVEDELRAAGDGLQALVGITMGPLGERLDASLRADLVSRLQLRTLAEHEVITTKGAPTVGLVVVGGGELELMADDGSPSGEVLRAGEFLFPGESLRAAPAPRTVRASRGGALVLHAERGVAQELLVTCPPLLEIFAGM
jgi:hypothetical protein